MLVFRAVLPPAYGCDEARVCLFVDGRSAPSSRAAVAAFERASWPADWVPCLVDVEREPEVARWFGISVFPTIAVVRNGLLLAVEVGQCSDEAFERVTLAAHQRLRQLWRRPL